jgi:predicted nucleotidyltransferase
MDEALTRDIETAARILKEAGATEVYLFGSAATGEPRPESDIDLAVRGIPPEHYFKAGGKVMLAVARPVDIVDLDSPTPFTDYLIRKRKLRRVG